MCGCMLMHAMMNHQEHQPTTQSASGPGADTMPASIRVRCTHCSYPLQQGFAFCPGCGMSLGAAECPAS